MVGDNKGQPFFVAICQPHYLPWIGYFEMIDRVDTFVFLDDVQYIKREWKNRNQVRKTSASTDTKWLTVPVKKHDQETSMSDMQISDHSDWKATHLSSMKDIYRNTPYFNECFPMIENAIRSESTGMLVELNVGLIDCIRHYLGITTPLARSNSLNVLGKREEKLRNICKKLNASDYLANNATGNYTGQDFFQEEGVGFHLQNYQHPQYSQRNKNDLLAFKSHLSIVDLLFNHGPESLAIIRSGRPQAVPNDGVSFSSMQASM